ncbi:serine hydrolase domain-containing protein [Paractinoplanes bogorensis]|nr:serine hydrolase domain-containing protein [Actinoplanes bogorensis]
MNLNDLLEQAAARHGVPGAAVAVGQGDELHEGAYGVLNRETGVETTPDSVFQIGSVTKIWTTALVMQLVDEGRVDLDQPVRRYLPEFAVVDPAATEAVTVRHLLLHMGGFDGDLFEDTGRGDDAVDRYLVHLAGHAHQIAPAGELFSYCNSGFVVLGALVARLRGGTWESVLRERLIEPLGVQQMALLPEEAIVFRAAAGHLDDGRVARPWGMPRSNGPAGATPCAAPRELVRFGHMFLAGGEGLLSAAAIEAMTTPVLTLPPYSGRGDSRRGLGLEVFDWSGTKAYGHDGGTIGQSTQWRVVPEHSLVIAINVNGGHSTPFFDEVLDAIVADRTGVVVPPRAVPPSGPFTPGPAEFAGRYEYPMYTYDIRPDPTGLEVTATPLGLLAEMGLPVTTMHYVALGGTSFITTELDEGVHSTFTFLDGGRYVYGGRVAKRVGS